jgi:hypothetical protein
MRVLDDLAVACSEHHRAERGEGELLVVDSVVGFLLRALHFLLRDDDEGGETGGGDGLTCGGVEGQSELLAKVHRRSLLTGEKRRMKSERSTHRNRTASPAPARSAASSMLAGSPGRHRKFRQ